jgi:tetratricopeptide (TPR) repeat protein
MTVDAAVEAMTEAAFRTGDFSVAEKLLEDARGAATDPAAEAAVLHQLGWLMHWRALDSRVDGQFHDADPGAEEALFQRALDIRRGLSDHAGVAASLFGVGLVRQVLNSDSDGAIGLFREALPLAEEHGDLITRSEIHRHIGFYHLVDEKNYDEALRYLRISLEMRRQHGDPRWIPSGTLALGQAYVMAGRPAEAVEYLRTALDESRAAGLHRQRVEQAETWLARAEAAARPTG